MGSTTKTVDTTPQATAGLRQAVGQYIFDPSRGGIAGQGNAQAPGAPPQVNVLGSQPVSTTFNSGTDINRGQVRDVASVDSLGGANSDFFKNMVAQLQPSFDQSRADAVASGKEARGSLTGSGLGNSIGANLNRSLGTQQATLANYASTGIGQELQRQQANQGADVNFMNALLQRNQQGIQTQQLSSNAEQFNSGQQTSRNQLQAQLDAQRGNTVYQGQLGVNQQNANNFMQLLMGQSLAGVSPSTVQQRPGIGAGIASGIGAGIGGYFGGTAGAQLGGGIGQGIGSSIFR